MTRCARWFPPVILSLLTNCLAKKLSFDFLYVQRSILFIVILHDTTLQYNTAQHTIDIDSMAQCHIPCTLSPPPPSPSPSKPFSYHITPLPLSFTLRPVSRFMSLWPRILPSSTCPTPITAIVLHWYPHTYPTPDIPHEVYKTPSLLSLTAGFRGDTLCYLCLPLLTRSDATADAAKKRSIASTFSWVIRSMC